MNIAFPSGVLSVKTPAGVQQLKARNLIANFSLPYNFNMSRELVDIGVSTPVAAHLINAAIKHGVTIEDKAFSFVAYTSNANYFSSSGSYLGLLKYLDFMPNGHFGVCIRFYDKNPKENFDIKPLKKAIAKALDDLLMIYKKINLDTIRLYNVNNEEEGLNNVILYQIDYYATEADFIALRDWLLDEAKTSPTVGKDLDPFRLEVYQTILNKRNEKLQLLEQYLHKKFIPNSDTRLQLHHQIYMTSMKFLNNILENRKLKTTLKEFEEFDKSTDILLKEAEEN